MLIRFTTNATVTSTGWSADYVSYGTYQGPCIDETFTAQSGSISDNSGPEEYVNNLDCRKLIQPSGAATVTLIFTAFDIEEGWDFVTVYDGATIASPELGSYSGSSLPSVLTSSGGSMLVQFTSDYSVTAQGWEASYITTMPYGIISDKSSRQKKEFEKTIVTFNISLYPNPTSEKIYFVCKELYHNDFTIEIYNLEGRVIQIIKLYDFTGLFEIDFTEYAAGVYYLKSFNKDFVDIQRIVLTQ
jgi:hypothetical protein